MAFIGLDLGTSFIKAAVLDLDARRMTHIRRRPFPSPLPDCPPLHREFDPWAVLGAVREVLAELLPSAQPCEGLVVCGLMHGLVFCDERGQPHSTLTTWQDQRDTERHPSGDGTYFDVMAARLTLDERRQLGNELRPGLPVGVLFWQAEQGRLPDRRLIPTSLPDFVLAHLSETAPTTGPSHAMAHGALNLEGMSWHRAVIDRLGLSDLAWPDLAPEGAVVARLRVAGADIPCYAPVGDFQCALAGALLQPRELSLNISTGSQVSTLLPQLAFGDFQTRPFFDNRFLATITHMPAGRALTGLVKLLSELAVGQGVTVPDPWRYIAEATTRSGPTRIKANLAFFTTVCGDHGELTNLREEELTVGHVFRAAFENMTDNYEAAARRLPPGGDWRGLVYSGGLAQRFPVLRELIDKRFGLPTRVCPSSEDTMLGLLALALAYTGRTASVAAAMRLLLDTYQEDHHALQYAQH